MKQDILQIRIDSELLNAVRNVVADRDTTMSLFVREAIREKLARTPIVQRPQPVGEDSRPLASSGRREGETLPEYAARLKAERFARQSGVSA